MASKTDFVTFLAPLWMDCGLIFGGLWQHVGDFWGVCFQGVFFDGFLCLRAVSRRLRESPGRDYREGKPSLRGEG